MKRLIASSQFTILLSLGYEVFRMSILESFTCGKPVIASRIGGIPEVIENNVNGFLFEPGNMDVFPDRILHLWNNQLLCQTLGKAALQTCISRFSLDKYYPSLIN